MSFRCANVLLNGSFFILPLTPPPPPPPQLPLNFHDLFLWTHMFQAAISATQNMPKQDANYNDWNHSENSVLWSCYWKDVQIYSFGKDIVNLLNMLRSSEGCQVLHKKITVNVFRLWQYSLFCQKIYSKPIVENVSFFVGISMHKHLRLNLLQGTLNRWNFVLNLILCSYI